MTENTLAKEEFWVEFKNMLFSEEKLESAEEEIENILELVDVKKGSALDIPCGIGRHSLELQRKGFEVTAVDMTSEYIKEARERDETESIEFLQENMKDFRREDSFNLILNGWNSFGYFSDRKEDREMLENIHASLKEDGVFVMDLWSKELTAKNSFDQKWTETNGIYNMEKREIKDNWNKVQTTWIKVEDDGKVEFTLEQRLYSARELEDLLKEIGFSNVSFYGSLEGDNYDENAEKMIVVAEK